MGVAGALVAGDAVVLVRAGAMPLKVGREEKQRVEDRPKGSFVIFYGEEVHVTPLIQWSKLQPSSINPSK